MPDIERLLMCSPLASFTVLSRVSTCSWINAAVVSGVRGNLSNILWEIMIPSQSSVLILAKVRSLAALFSIILAFSSAGSLSKASFFTFFLRPSSVFTIFVALGTAGKSSLVRTNNFALGYNWRNSLANCSTTLLGRQYIGFWAIPSRRISIPAACISKVLPAPTQCAISVLTRCNIRHTTFFWCGRKVIAAFLPGKVRCAPLYSLVTELLKLSL